MGDKTLMVAEVLENDYATFEKELQLPEPYLYETYICADLDHHPENYDAYWYHPDHLGSSNYITNLAGRVNQHMEYLPFGETLVEEHLNSYNSPYKFNAKEFDAETGWYYYGARYYNPKWSIWLSVDPLAHKYPSWSTYNYTFQNPIRYVDPDGNAPACTNCPWPSSLKSFGNYLADRIDSGLKSIGDGLRSVGKTIATPFVMVSNYLEEGGDGFNFYSKNGGGGDPGRKGGRDTQMVNADGILQAARFGKTGKMEGPKQNPKDYLDVSKNILTIVGNTSDGIEIGGDAGEKLETVTTIRAVGIEKIGQNTKIGHTEKVRVTVPASKVDSVLKADTEGLKTQRQIMGFKE